MDAEDAEGCLWTRFLPTSLRVSLEEGGGWVRWLASLSNGFPI